MNILVTGVTGLVGNLVARRLRAGGHLVRGMVRNFKSLESARENYGDAIIAELTNPASLAEAVTGMDVVIHCAGLVGSGRGDDGLYQSINAYGTHSLLNAAAAAGVKRFVFMSTVGVYGTNTMKPDVKEETPYGTSSGYANSKIEAEKIIRAGTVPFTILRPYWITGGGDRFLIPQIARLLKNGAFTFIGKGQQEWSLSVAENISHAVVTAALHPAAENQIYNVADARVKIADTVQVIAEGLGLPMPTRHSSLLSAAFRSLLNQSPSNPASISIDLFFPLWRGLTINTDKIHRELNWEPQIDWRASLRQGVREWKQAAGN